MGAVPGETMHLSGQARPVGGDSWIGKDGGTYAEAGSSLGRQDPDFISLGQMRGAQYAG